MGLFDKNDKGLFGGLFDFNGDGKTTWDEEFLAFKIFEECTKEEDDSDSDFDSDLFDDTDNSDKYEWRIFCEDGTEYGVYPEDYETEEEYADALDEAKYGWRDSCESVLDTGVDPEDYETEDEYRDALEERTAWRDNCEDGAEYGIEPDDFETEDEYEEALAEERERISDAEITIDFSVECPALDKLDKIREEDYPNKRRYNAAYTLANELVFYSDSDYEKDLMARCRFIIDNADTIPAADYLSHDGEFLYAQAIKDNFSVPCSLPDEDETRKLEFYEVLCKIAKYDVPLSFEVWSWCMEQFLPYAEYDDRCGNDLSAEVIDELYSFPDDYITKLVHHMSDNDSFCQTVMTAGGAQADSIPELIVETINEGLFETAEYLFRVGLENLCGNRKKIIAFTDEVILLCKNYEELESVEYFRDNLLPLVKAIPLGKAESKIAQWEKDIAVYIDFVETECEQYAYTRKNAWRKAVPSGEEYGIDPVDFDTEQEYLDALNAEVNDASQPETDEILNEQEKIKKYVSDKTVYTYCGVLIPFSTHPYSFRTDDNSIKIGDTVIVPVGENDKEMKGRVVSIGQYLRLSAPYPVEKTKLIIRKAEEGSENRE